MIWQPIRPLPGHGLGTRFTWTTALRPWSCRNSWMTIACWESAADVTTGMRPRRFWWLPWSIDPNCRIKSPSFRPASEAGERFATASILANGVLVTVTVGVGGTGTVVFAGCEGAVEEEVAWLLRCAVSPRFSKDRLSPFCTPATVPSQFLTTHFPVFGSYFGFGLGAARFSCSFFSASNFSGF